MEKFINSFKEYFKIKYFYPLLATLISAGISLFIYLNNRDNVAQLSILPNYSGFITLDANGNPKFLLNFSPHNSSATVSGIILLVTAQLSLQGATNQRQRLFKSSSIIEDTKTGDFNPIEVFPKSTEHIAIILSQDTTDIFTSSIAEGPVQSGKYLLILTTKNLGAKQSLEASYTFTLTAKDILKMTSQSKRNRFGNPHPYIKIPLDYLDK